MSSTVIAKNIQVGADGTASNNFTIFQPATPDGTLRIGNGNTGITASLVAVTSAGNVGIGTSSPGSNRLYITAPDGTAPLTLNSAGGSDTTRALNFNVAGDNYGKILVPSGSGGAMAFWTGGANAAAERARIDSSGNVGIGTSSPSYKLDVSASSFITASFSTSYSGAGNIRIADASTTSASAPYIGSVGNNLTFGRLGTAEYARIDSSGRLLVGKTTNGDYVTGIEMQPAGAVLSYRTSGVAGIFGRTDNGETVRFTNNGNGVGNISTTGSATAYNTSSDYRLKHDIAPMTGALAKVQALNPVTYKWNADNSESQGFIAHELQAVVPDCVTGEKDAVDADGNPVYQGIDTSFLVATLTAAIQEQQAIITALTARVTALEGAQP